MKTDSTPTMKVALFPIPEMVTFPNTLVPLHVFEPRYRVMINHCVETQMKLAIAHTKKIKGQPKRPIKHTTEDVDELNKNQTSYEPHDVFSAGLCQVLDTTDDGRIQIEVNLQHRLQLIAIEQEIPFQIVNCRELVDQVELSLSQQEEDLKQEIYAVLLAISESQSPKLHTIISQHEWKNATPADFSFKVFQYFRFEADFMQHVLEQTSISLRLELIWQGLTHSLRR